MEKTDKTANNLSIIRLIIYSIFTAGIAGSIMAILNITVEGIKGNSSIGFVDLFQI